MKKEIEVFKEFQRELLKNIPNEVDVQFIYDISKKIQRKFDLAFPEAGKSWNEIIDEHRNKFG